MEMKKYLTVTMEVGDMPDGHQSQVRAVGKFVDEDGKRMFEVEAWGSQPPGNRVTINEVAERVMRSCVETALSHYYPYTKTRSIITVMKKVTDIIGHPNKDEYGRLVI